MSRNGELSLITAREMRKTNEKRSHSLKPTVLIQQILNLDEDGKKIERISEMLFPLHNLAESTREEKTCTIDRRYTNNA